MPARRSFGITARHKGLVVASAWFYRSGRWHGRTSEALAISLVSKTLFTVASPSGWCRCIGDKARGRVLPLRRQAMEVLHKISKAQRHAGQVSRSCSAKVFGRVSRHHVMCMPQKQRSCQIGYTGQWHKFNFTKNVKKEHDVSQTGDDSFGRRTTIIT